MKTAIIAAFFFFTACNFTLAQQQPLYQYFDFSELDCGGRYLTGNLVFYSAENTYSRRGFNEDNRFFLEIAPAGSEEYQVLPQGHAVAGNSGSARFVLPENLMIGKDYKVRMSSTSPRYTAEEPAYFTYAGLLQPFTAKFGQQVHIREIAQASLRVSLETAENKYGNLYQPHPYTLQLNDGSTFVKDVWSAGNFLEVKVQPTDSLTVYKINEITNRCGLKGRVEGEAVVVKNNYLSRINIATVSGIPEICKGVPVGLKIDARMTSEAERFRVEFSPSSLEGSFISVGAYSPDKDKNVWVKTPGALEENRYLYCRVVRESTGEVSDLLFLNRTGRTNQITGYLTQVEMDNLHLAFYPQVDADFPYGPTISTMVVNGKELRQGEELNNGIFILPLPKRDTSFVVTHAATACESVPVAPVKIDYKREKMLFYSLNTDKNEFCEGEEAEIHYALSEPGKLDVKGFYAAVNARSYVADKLTGEPTGNVLYYPSIPLDVKINKERSTLTVTIPRNLHSLFTAGTNYDGNFMFRIGLAVGYAGSNESGVELWGNRLEKNIRIQPELSLAASEIKSVPGQALIPVKFKGGELRFELSNGWSGEVRHLLPDCYGCRPLITGEILMPVPVNDDTVIRVKSVHNACGIGTSDGETRIHINKSAPYLTINEAAIGGKVCVGRAFDVPFTIGNPDGSEVTLGDDSGTIRILTEEEIRSGSFQLTLRLSGYRYETSFWLQCGNTRSNTVKVKLEEPPVSFRISVADNYSRHSEGDMEVYQVLEGAYLSPSIISSGGVSSFRVNGADYIPYHNSGISSQLYLSDVKLAPYYILNSITNACGTNEVNQKFMIRTSKVILKVQDITEKKFLLKKNCPGTLRYYEVSYSGSQPSDDRLTVELLPRSGEPISIPFQKEGKILRVEIPEGLEGVYELRVKSEATRSHSEAMYLGYFLPEPEVRLVSLTGENEVAGDPGAILRLESNYAKAGAFSVKMNTGETITSAEFGIYYSYSTSEESKETIPTLQNYGYRFTPAQTTTYRVESVFSNCGQGKSAGSVRVVVFPSVTLKYSDPFLSGQPYCAGAEVELSLSYTEGFPKDTLMGLYLHDARDTRNYRELATFKELRGQVSFRLPDDLEQGVYSLQVRKSSRGRVNGSIWKRDSLSIASMDSPSLSLGLITPPRVQLVGNTEIFEGESTDLQLFSVDIQGKRAGELGEGVENYVTLNNGVTYALANSFISVSPPVTETFTITSVNNICGTGKGFGEVMVVVYPLSGKRMAARGFLRSQPQFNEWYYETAMRLCAGVQDSLDVIFYGWEKNETPGVERIALTDGQGGSGLPVTVSRLEEVFFPPPPVGGRMLRLWFEVPETAAGGNSYRIKAVPADPAVAATPLPQPGTIFKPPVASLSGSVITQTGRNEEA